MARVMTTLNSPQFLERPSTGMDRLAGIFEKTNAAAQLLTPISTRAKNSPESPQHSGIGAASTAVPEHVGLD